MNSLAHPLVAQWIDIALSAQYHHYQSTLTPGKTDTICIELDIQRTFPEHLSEHEKYCLKNCLTKAAAEFSELGYRSGFHLIVSILNKLTNNNQYMTITIFKYILFSKNIGIGKIILDQSFGKFINIFQSLVKREIPQDFQDVILIQSIVVQIKAFLCYHLEWENVDNLALLWDKIFRILKKVILTHQTGNKQKIDIQTIPTLLSAQIKSNDQYLVD